MPWGRSRSGCSPCSAGSTWAAGTRRKHGFHLYTIVIGSQALHATGYAMGVERDGLVGTGDPERDTAVIGYFGDGAMSQGDVNEAFVFASSYNAPIVFFCQNNQWAISEPIERQSRIPLYRRAAGFGFPGVRVDGNDVLAVHAVTTAALERARSGNGPTLIEAYTYRMGAHTTSDDPTKYRLADELEHWRLKDPIERVRAYLTRHGAADDDFFAEVETEAAELAAPCGPTAWRCRSRRMVETFDWVYAEQTPYLAEQQARVRRVPGHLRGRSRGRCGMTKLTLAKALNAGLRRALEADPKVVLAGEDIGKLGGVFRVTEGLQKDFGEHRVIDSPLAESGIIGTAVGMAMRGYRPVCEIQFDGFVYPAFDQIVTQVAKMHFRSRGPAADADGDPDPVRRRHRGGRAPQRVAGGLLRAHGRAEGRRLRQPGRCVLDDPAGGGLGRPGDVLRAEAALPREGRGRRVGDPAAAARGPGRPDRRRGDVAGVRADGQDLPGRGRRRRGGRPRSRGDRPPLAVPARHGRGGPRRREKTGRVITVHEAPLNLGLGAELAARITEQCFYSLEAPVLRVGGFDMPYPPSRVEDEYLPDLDRVLDAVDRSLAY